MTKELNKRIKNLDAWDVACTKMSVMFFVLFVFSVWTDFRSFVLSVNPWLFFFGWVVFAIRPLKRVTLK